MGRPNFTGHLGKAGTIQKQIFSKTAKIRVFSSRISLIQLKVFFCCKLIVSDGVKTKKLTNWDLLFKEDPYGIKCTR